jgi:hypothetical protein
MNNVFALIDDTIPSRKLLLLIKRDMEAHTMRFSKDLMELIHSHDVNNTNILVVDKYIEEDNLVNLSMVLAVVFDHIIFFRNEAVKNFSGNFQSNVSFMSSLPGLIERGQVQRRSRDVCKPSMNAQSDFNAHFFIRCEKSKIIKIETSNILFVEANQNQVRIQTTTNMEVTSSTLTKIEQLLPKFMFMRVHRSFIVNLERIKAIEARKIQIADGVSIPVGQSYRKLVFDKFRSRIIN